MTTPRRWPGPTKAERPAWARMYEGGGLISDDLYALEEEDDVRPRATTDPIRTPPRSLSVLAYGAVAFGGALVGAALMGLAWVLS